jgi:hypothetical protein
MSTSPIPKDLAQGFRDAVEFFGSSWSAAEHGREVSINGHPYKIEEVCNLVVGYADNLPDDVVQKLLSYMDLRYDYMKEDLALHANYRIGALCLRKLVQDGEAEYQQCIRKA